MTMRGSMMMSGSFGDRFDKFRKSGTSFRGSGTRFRDSNCSSRVQEASTMRLAMRRSSRAFRKGGGGPRNPTWEKTLTHQIKASETFGRSCRKMCKTFSLPFKEVEGFSLEIVALCWQFGQDILTGDGHLAKALRDNEILKKRIADCNLTAMKQMEAVKAKLTGPGFVDSVSAWDLNAVTFHEPLQYLDQEHRDLVIELVAQKLTQLEEGTSPPSFLKALWEYMGSKWRPRGRALGDSEEEEDSDDDAAVAQTSGKKRVEDLSKKLTSMEHKVEVAEAEVEETKKQLAEARRQCEIATQTANEMRAAAVQATEEKLSAEATCAELQEREVALKEENAVLQAQTRQLRDAAAQTFEEVASLKKSLADAAVQAQEALEKALKEQKENFERQRLANMRSHSVQTDLTMEDLDKQAAEVKKLKMVHEELQLKVKELVKKCKEEGMGDTVEDIANDIGLAPVLSRRKVFERLYNDAMERVARLEDLRRRVEDERNRLHAGGISAEVAAAVAAGTINAAFIPVLQSDLPPAAPTPAAPTPAAPTPAAARPPEPKEETVTLVRGRCVQSLQAAQAPAAERAAPDQNELPGTAVRGQGVQASQALLQRSPSMPVPPRPPCPTTQPPQPAKSVQDNPAQSRFMCRSRETAHFGTIGEALLVPKKTLSHSVSLPTLPADRGGPGKGAAQVAVAEYAMVSRRLIPR